MDKPTPKPRQFPAEPPQFSATAPAAPRKDQFAPSKPFPATPPQVDLSYDAVQQVPKINAKPWQIAVQNRRATKSKEIGVGDFIANPTQTVSETAAQWAMQRKELENQMNPEYARIEAAKAALEQLFAERPELAEQAKLSMPNEAQLGVAGIAAILQPNRAFESLATPFQFQQEEQARQQQLNNQQFASDQQEWGLMWQRAIGDLNTEISMETNRQKNVLGAIESLDQLTSDIYSQDAQTQRTAMTVQGREQVAGMNNEAKLAQQLLRDEAAMDRLVYKDPSVALPRLEAKLIERGFTPEDARNYAYAAVQSDWFKNEQARAATLERLTLLPIKVQQGVANIAKTQADIDYIAARSEYVRSQAEALGDDYALNLMKYGLEVDKFNRSKETGDAQATLKGAEALLGAQQARAKVLGDQLKAAQDAFTVAAEGSPEQAQAKARVDALTKELATTNNDILSAVRAMETLTGTRPQFSLGGLVQQGVQNIVGGAAASGGRFRPADVKAATQNVVCRSGAQCAEGLTQALQNLGFDIPTMLGAEQTARWALNNGGRIVTDPQPGDIVWVEGPGYGGVQANGRRSGHHVELYAGNGMVWNRRTGRWTNDKANRHVNARRVRYIRLPR